MRKSINTILPSLGWENSAKKEYCYRKLNSYHEE